MISEDGGPSTVVSLGIMKDYPRLVRSVAHFDTLRRLCNTLTAIGRDRACPQVLIFINNANMMRMKLILVCILTPCYTISSLSNVGKHYAAIAGSDVVAALVERYRTAKYSDEKSLPLQPLSEFCNDRTLFPPLLIPFLFHLY